MRFWTSALMVAAVATLAAIFRSGITKEITTVVRPLTAIGAKRFRAPSSFLQPKSDQDRSDMAESELPTQNPISILSEAAPADEKVVEKELPKLSTSDFRQYNKLAVMMDAYHNHFRHTWNMLYNAATNNERPGGMSIRGFIGSGLQLCRQLTAHHTIEERWIFPELAERMPIFRENELLLTQHEQIHEGLVKMEEYLGACLTGEKELKMDDLKAIMDTFGTVLWSHLDEEVQTLGAENMRKYWSKEEIGNMNW